MILSKATYPLVVKADGLASGKGLFVKILVKLNYQLKKFLMENLSKAEKLLIEEFLDGKK